MKWKARANTHHNKLIDNYSLEDGEKDDRKKLKRQLKLEAHTVGPANREVPESAIAAQLPAQYPEEQ